MKHAHVTTYTSKSPWQLFFEVLTGIPTVAHILQKCVMNLDKLLGFNKNAYIQLYTRKQ